MGKTSYKWYALGDVNAFFGLMLDNIANLLIVISLLRDVYGFSSDFVLQTMIPGTAIGVLVGDLLFFAMAFLVARQTGRQDVTAMPLGIDTPSTIGMVFFVLGPAYQQALRATADGGLGMEIPAAQQYVWHIGICCLVVSGVFKLLCSLVSNWIRRVIPRAGLLGSLAAIALVIITFLPLLEGLRTPVVVMVSMAIILTTLVARVRLPWRIPGAMGAMLVGSLIYFLMQWMGQIAPETHPQVQLMPTGWLEAFSFQWTGSFRDAVNYFPLVIPFALATVIGGIDCTESAAAVGDEYDTGQVIAVEAVATLAAGLCGGVLQTTPYIGHPAYKAMGGRAAYTLATAVFVGLAGIVGYFGYLHMFIPKASVVPILLFIGLEITAQSFHATPTRHYPAAVIAVIPALAQFGWILIQKVTSGIANGIFVADPKLLEAGGKIDPAAVTLIPFSQLLVDELLTIRMLANGFIITSLLWASALAALIDRQLRRAAVFFLIAGGCTLIGVIHSPLPGGDMFLPTRLAPEFARATYEYAISYGLMAALLYAWGEWLNRQDDAREVPASHED